MFLNECFIQIYKILNMFTIMCDTKDTLKYFYEIKLEWKSNQTKLQLIFKIILIWLMINILSNWWG